MKKPVMVAIVLALAALAFLAAGCDQLTPPSSMPASSVGGAATQSTGIWVSGEGKVTVVPDIAILNLGVQAQESTVAQAQSETSDAMNAVVAALKSGGVADKDIQTQQYYITPIWTTNRDTGQQTLSGYRVTNTVTAKIRNVSATGDIIQAVVNAGGNYTTINGISFTVDDPSPYQKQARQAAMADAQARASQLAAAAGVKLGAPTYISESGGVVPITSIPLPSAGAPAPAPPPISPGESTITVDVQVVYGIK
jgi:uncharacterized protein YggE